MSARTTTLALILGSAAAVWAAPAPPPPPNPPGGSAAPSGNSAPANAVMPGASAGSATPMSAEQAKALDGALGQAETIVLDLEIMAKGGVDGTGCPPGFTVRDYMLDMRSRKNVKETGDDILDSDATHKEDSGPKLDWQLYYLCEALATRNPSACAEAGSVTPKTVNRNVDYKAGLENPDAITTEAALAMQQSQSYQGKCVNSFYRERVRAAFLSKAPNFMDVCREGLPKMAEVKDQASGDAICRAWRDYNGNPEPFIAAIQGGVAHPFKRQYALDVVREMTVAPGVCHTLSREYFRRVCREQEDFRKALQSQNKAECRTGICKVLMGEGQAACEAYAKPFRAAACTQRYAVDFLQSRAGTFKSLTDQAEKALSNPDLGIGDPKSLKELNARLDKLYDLRDRFQRAAETIDPALKRKRPLPAEPKAKKGV